MLQTLAYFARGTNESRTPLKTRRLVPAYSYPITRCPPCFVSGRLFFPLLAQIHACNGEHKFYLACRKVFISFHPRIWMDGKIKNVQNGAIRTKNTRITKNCRPQGPWGYIKIKSKCIPSLPQVINFSPHPKATSIDKVEFNHHPRTHYPTSIAKWLMTRKLNCVPH